jgi:hypothetical protein
MRSTLRVCATAFAFMLGMATASLGYSASDPGGGSARDASTREAQASPMACCKVCTKGKACGNSCIAKDKKCHQPPGCACDG